MITYQDQFTDPRSIWLTDVTLEETGTTLTVGGSIHCNGKTYPVSGVFDTAEPGELFFHYEDGTLSTKYRPGLVQAHVCWFNGAGEVLALHHISNVFGLDGPPVEPTPTA